MKSFTRVKMVLIIFRMARFKDVHRSTLVRGEARGGK